MADDDFDIDIYGDTSNELDVIYRKDDGGDVRIDGIDNMDEDTIHVNGNQEGYEEYVEIKVGNNQMHMQQQIKTRNESNHDLLKIPRQAPQRQGVKRKEGSDERPIDPGATTALLVSDLHWWNTDDDIRGWINQAQCEDELKEITFSEHKINGKSKGQAYVEFTTQQAATAAKHKIDTFGDGQQYVKKHIATYSNPNVNPFRTLPKDAPIRENKGSQSNHTSGGTYINRNGQGNNFRGRSSGYISNRGNMGNTAGGNFNRNFSASQMNNNITGGFQPPMGNFQGTQMGGPYGGFNRGGMMGGIRGGSSNMRGGRVGMGNGMMMGMPLGGMPIGAMGGAMVGMAGMAAPMGMSQMGGGMPAGAGFQSLQSHFNPAFFQPNQPAGGDWQNPHGAKRPRPE